MWWWAQCRTGSYWCWRKTASALCSRSWCRWHCTCTGRPSVEQTLTWKRWQTPAEARNNVNCAPIEQSSRFHLLQWFWAMILFFTFLLSVTELRWFSDHWIGCNWLCSTSRQRFMFFIKIFLRCGVSQEEEDVYQILALNCIPNWNFSVKGPIWDKLLQPKCRVLLLA